MHLRRAAPAAALARDDDFNSTAANPACALWNAQPGRVTGGYPGQPGVAVTETTILCAAESRCAALFESVMSHPAVSSSSLRDRSMKRWIVSQRPRRSQPGVVRRRVLRRRLRRTQASALCDAGADPMPPTKPSALVIASSDSGEGRASFRLPLAAIQSASARASDSGWDSQSDLISGSVPDPAAKLSGEARRYRHKCADFVGCRAGGALDICVDDEIVTLAIHETADGAADLGADVDAQRRTSLLCAIRDHATYWVRGCGSTPASLLRPQQPAAAQTTWPRTRKRQSAKHV